ncbi:hypothetical protein A9G34_05110 [Gilliamella sp. Choc4-2]|nr:hypothetical protein A9G33_09815 [Gilliamella apicola]OCG46280.1 hypothetical protein A9G34_05110 [Gilliamella apicola]OCG55662.1 hypothetical protein A9G36_04455 [Gilliamella apicola]
MVYFLYVLYFLEVCFIFPGLGNNGIGTISPQEIINFIIVVLFIFNCIVNFFYILLKKHKRRADYIVVALLFSFITFVPINNTMKEINDAKSMERMENNIKIQ